MKTPLLVLACASIFSCTTSEKSQSDADSISHDSTIVVAQAEAPASAPQPSAHDILFDTIYNILARKGFVSGAHSYGELSITENFLDATNPDGSRSLLAALVFPPDETAEADTTKKMAILVFDLTNEPEIIAVQYPGIRAGCKLVQEVQKDSEGECVMSLGTSDISLAEGRVAVALHRSQKLDEGDHYRGYQRFTYSESIDLYALVDEQLYVIFSYEEFSEGFDKDPDHYEAWSDQAKIAYGKMSANKLCKIDLTKTTEAGRIDPALAERETYSFNGREYILN